MIYSYEIHDDQRDPIIAIRDGNGDVCVEFSIAAPPIFSFTTVSGETVTLPVNLANKPREKLRPQIVHAEWRSNDHLLVRYLVDDAAYVVVLDCTMRTAGSALKLSHPRAVVNLTGSIPYEVLR